MRYQYFLESPGFSVENIDITNVSRGKGYRHSYRNGRMNHGFIYVVKGILLESFLSADIEDICVHTGDLLFIPKDCAYYGTYLEEDTEIKIVQFDLASGTLPAYLCAPVKIELPNAGEIIGTFFKAQDKHPLYYLSCIYNLLWQVDDCLSKMPAKYRHLQPALGRISDQYQENEKVSHYARLCGMSEVHFRRLFREYTGKAPIEYRNDIRLHNARAMLQSGEFNVSEAAEACGFTNLSFFIRLYKKKYGYTPKKE